MLKAMLRVLAFNAMVKKERFLDQIVTSYLSGVLAFNTMVKNRFLDQHERMKR